MIALGRTAAVVAVVSCVGLAGPDPAREGVKHLAKEDEKLLQSLLRDFLFDPRGTERVQVMVEGLGGRFGSDKQEPREGWLVKRKGGDQVFFTDGESMPAPPKDRISKVDFLAKCRKLYAGKPPAGGGAVFGLLLDRRPSGEWGEEPTLVFAAWLYRLGNKELAAQVLAHAPADRVADAALLRTWLAQSALNRMIAAFASYQDQLALAHGQRLLRLYPLEALELPQASALVSDLHRRKQQGTLCKKASRELPEGFSRWNKKKQLAFLLESLHDTEDYLPGLRGTNRLQSSPRVAALIKIGEPAVPAVLDMLEKDPGMTRCAQGPSKWASLATVQPVREAALAVLSEILGVRQLDPYDLEAEDLWGSPQDLAKAAVAARAYWKAFGPLTFEERMMRVLADPGSSFPALREAAANLAGKIGPDDTIWPILVKDHKPRPAILKFNNPTAAQAIIAAMDRDLAHDDAQPQTDHNRAYHEPHYFSALIRLGDRRIAPELARRAADENNALMRLRWAYASHRLGNSTALRTFADDFAASKVVLSSDDEGAPSRWQLEHTVEYLAAVKLPEADRALFRLAEKNHRYHAAAVRGLIDRQVVYDSPGSFLDHPCCVPILRELLDDTTLTKTSLKISENENGLIRRNFGGGVGWTRMPAILADPKQRKAATDLRRCDLAGQMAGLIAGLPEYHPLLKDAETRLAAMRKALDRFPGEYRTLTPTEKVIIAGNTYEVRFAPKVLSLGRPATAGDVKAGKAIFHLDGRGKLAAVELPARGTFKRHANDKDTRCGLLVQAEVRPNGEIVYGVIERHAVGTRSASEFADVTPLWNIRSGN
jgi:hypothetical protein